MVVIKKNRYGITEEELICDVAVGCSGELIISSDSRFAESFVDDEDKRIARQLEALVLRRLECRNAALRKFATDVDEKAAEDSWRAQNFSKKPHAAEKRRFPKFFDFLETLSKEDSVVKVEAESEKAQNSVCVFQKGFGKSKQQDSMPALPAPGDLSLAKHSESGFRFAPPNFSTPKFTANLSASSGMPLTLFPTPLLSRKCGHPTLTRTDTNAASVTVAVSTAKNLFEKPLESVFEAAPSSSVLKSVNSSPSSSILNAFHQPMMGLSVSENSVVPLPKEGIENEKQILSENVKEACESDLQEQILAVCAPDGIKANIELHQSIAVKDKQIWVMRLPFDNFLRNDETSETGVTEFDKRSKDVLHNLAKRSVKEKIACWTRKNASFEVVKSAVDYFFDLLTGKTVYGFDGKMLNFNGDEPGTRFSMASIVNSYVGVIQKDMQLIECSATVLLSLMVRIPIFKSHVYGKLFAASPLLRIDSDECSKQISSIREADGNVSEAVNSWCNSQSAVVRLFVLLHCPETKKNAVVLDENFDYSARLWSFLAAAVAEKSPFASALTSEILKAAGGLLARVYGVQFRKLVAFISAKILKTWKESLITDFSNSDLSRMAVGYYLAVLDMAVKEFVEM